MPVTLSFSQRLTQSLLFSWDMVVDLWPYVVGGVVIAALTKQLIPAKRLAGIGKGHGVVSVVSASILGIVSPLCTYGTVPILFQFCRSGGAVGPALAFVVASSLANPQVLALTQGAFGPWMMVARVLSSLIISVGAGLLTLRVDGRQLLNSEALMPEETAPGTQHKHGHHCPRSSKGLSAKRFLSDSMDIGGFIGLYFLIGLLISGFTKFFIPREWLNAIMMGQRWYSIVIATTLGAPFYACGGGSIPAVRFLVGNEIMDPGGALAFLTSGPALRLSCLAALSAFLNRRTLFFYALYIFLGAFLFGTLFGLLARAYPWLVDVGHVTRIPIY